MVIIVIVSNKIIIRKASNDLLEKIEKRFTFSDTSECFCVSDADKKRGRYWRKSFDKSKIKYIKFLDTKKNTMPIGLLDSLTLFLLNNVKQEYKIIDKRKFKNFNVITDKHILPYLENGLRDYQLEAVNACITNKNGIIKLATGAGKTEIMLALCKHMDLSTLIIVPSLDLLAQTKKRIKKAALDENKIVVMNFHSLHKLDLRKFEMVLVDECHTARNVTIDNVLKNRFLYRFGFSATPFDDAKLNNFLVKKWLGEIIYTVPNELLISCGYLAVPFINFQLIDKPHTLQNSKIKWTRAEREGIIQNDYRNNVIIEHADSKKRGVLILVKKIKHGQYLAEKINNSIFVSGSVEKKERQLIIDKFDNGKIPVLIASTIFDQGISINNIFTLIIAGGGNSVRKTIQRLGRGLRITASKNKVEIIEFYDACNPILEKQSKQRIKDYLNEGFVNINQPEKIEKQKAVKPKNILIKKKERLNDY